jgi:hypothetical protein
VRRTIDDTFLADIARQYREHVAVGTMPAPAIAATEDATVASVHRWVREARKRGMLPPGTPPGLCGGAHVKKPLGAAGDNVRWNVLRLRTERRLSTPRLSAALKELDRPIAATGITKIEKGDRRVDVDDLVALAAALSVTPVQLLEPPTECATCHGTPPPGFACTACGAGGATP